LSFELVVTVSIIFVTIFASVILLKFWMDFKLEACSRENHVIYQRYKPVPGMKKSRNKLYNKKQSEDIIIDVDVEVINEDKSKEYVYVQKERLLK